MLNEVTRQQRVKQIAIARGVKLSPARKNDLDAQMRHAMVVIKQAGLNNTFIALLIDTTRAAVHRWDKHGLVPIGRNVKKLTDLADKLRPLISDGTLPFLHGTPRKQQWRALCHMLGTTSLVNAYPEPRQTA